MREKEIIINQADNKVKYPFLYWDSFSKGKGSRNKTVTLFEGLGERLNFDSWDDECGHLMKTNKNGDMWGWSRYTVSRRVVGTWGHVSTGNEELKREIQRLSGRISIRSGEYSAQNFPLDAEEVVTKESRVFAARPPSCNTYSASLVSCNPSLKGLEEEIDVSPGEELIVALDLSSIPKELLHDSFEIYVYILASVEWFPPKRTQENDSDEANDTIADDGGNADSDDIDGDDDDTSNRL